MIDKQKLINYLDTFVLKMEGNDTDSRKIYHDPENETFFYIGDHNFDDFCKQVKDDYVGIFVDSDFWIVAQLPSSYKDLKCSDIVDALWGINEDDDILPDHGTPEYDEYFDNIRFEYWKILNKEHSEGIDSISSLSLCLLSTKPEFYNKYKEHLNNDDIWNTILNHKKQYEIL